jgi:hypothetical protein
MDFPAIIFINKKAAVSRQRLSHFYPSSSVSNQDAAPQVT